MSIRFFTLTHRIMFVLPPAGECARFRYAEVDIYASYSVVLSFSKVKYFRQNRMSRSNNDSSNNQDATPSESINTGCASVAIKHKISFESEYCKRPCMNLYLHEETADVHFVFLTNGERKKLPAHKYMLGIGSPVFQSMFYGSLKEQGDVVITDATIEAFEEFLQFFYLADVKLTIENAAEVMNLVNKYGAVECFSICEQFLLQNLTMESVCGALELAITFDRIELRQALMKEIMETTDGLFASDSFKNCTPGILKRILECESLNCTEKAVFDACVVWSENACIKENLNPSEMLNIREQLGECLHLIQFAVMDREDISRCVVKYNELFTREELLEIITILSADNTTTLQYFVRKNRAKSTEWKEDAALLFSHIDLKNAYVNQVEVTGIQTNKKLLLGAVATQIVSTKRYLKKELLGVMTIREMKDSKNLDDNKILLEQPFIVTLSGNAVTRNSIQKLIKPIVVVPNALYTIKIVFDSSWIKFECMTKKCSSADAFCHSIQDYTVKFGGGIILHLYFNF